MQSPIKSDSYWMKKNSYYYKKLKQFYTFTIPKNSTVLQINCRSGFLLEAVQPSYGLGIDMNETYIQEAQERFKNNQNIHFKNISLDTLIQEESKTFDYIIISYTLMQEYDIQNLLQKAQHFCAPHTKVIINICSWLWEPIIKFGEKIKLCRKSSFKNWIQLADLENFLKLSDYHIVSKQYRTLIPKYIPLISSVFNKFIANIPLINRLCIDQCIVAKSRIKKLDPKKLSCSVIVPCKNERGNIQRAINKTPQMGTHTEVIFVEGGSQDGTLEEVKKLCQSTKRNNISFKYLQQSGKGKINAVKEGFTQASGDVLMILDADLTVPPEELSKFWNALIAGKGEFINGVRLVYAMENQAMMHLNLIANKMFSLGFSWLFNQRIKDTLCGTKVLLKRNWQNIEKERAFLGTYDPFGDFDLIFGAVKTNLKLIDLPVHYKERTYGSTQISRIKHGVILLKMAIIGTWKFKIMNR